MTTFKARISLKNGLRDTVVEADAEWIARDLLMAEYGIDRYDIKYVKRVESRSGSGSPSASDDDDDGGEEPGVMSKLFTGVAGLGVWAVLGWIVLKITA